MWELASVRPWMSSARRRTESMFGKTIMAKLDAQPRVRGEHSRPRVCMVAYSDYDHDARIRREAETLAANGFGVTCLKLRNGSTRAEYVLNGVDVREMNVAKYQGKSQGAYLRSYVRFRAEAAETCVGVVL